jgi:hypothetical protein
LLKEASRGSVKRIVKICDLLGAISLYGSVADPMVGHGKKVLDCAHVQGMNAGIEDLSTGHLKGLASIGLNSAVGHLIIGGLHC